MTSGNVHRIIREADGGIAEQFRAKDRFFPLSKVAINLKRHRSPLTETASLPRDDMNKKTGHGLSASDNPKRRQKEKTTRRQRGTSASTLKE